MPLSPNFFIITSDNGFSKLVENFNIASEGLAHRVIDVNANTIRLLPRQMNELLNDLNFEFYNYSKEFKSYQGLSTVYYLSLIFGRNFIKNGERVTKIKGFANALLYQQILKHLLGLNEELVLVNTHQVSSNYQRYVDDVASSLLEALKPVDELGIQQIKALRGSIEHILVYLKKRSKIVIK
ncbi:hypothetical protein [Wohlfahrtiimonas larvae]|uniref:Uncharacterized protein n=1 Tax=Wohlfahrtiimonas larvae TaxID=1157986 RepID=A0ABP9MDY1_9GAMM|nr:hypothetical protein [Wohlfahrtiimonas larvae]